MCNAYWVVPFGCVKRGALCAGYNPIPFIHPSIQPANQEFICPTDYPNRPQINRPRARCDDACQVYRSRLHAAQQAEEAAGRELGELMRAAGQAQEELARRRQQGQQGQGQGQQGQGQGQGHGQQGQGQGQGHGQAQAAIAQRLAALQQAVGDQGADVQAATAALVSGGCGFRLKGRGRASVDGGLVSWCLEVVLCWSTGLFPFADRAGSSKRPKRLILPHVDAYTHRAFVHSQARAWLLLFPCCCTRCRTRTCAGRRRWRAHVRAGRRCRRHVGASPGTGRAVDPHGAVQPP